ncbi:hypothetical protein [Pseudomonas moorei]|uniref:hypothetical protein n=1 Tax=Pseudomonas moorei TaxID=395599 RepID=UPI00200FDA30|nr:hypothetical protein [Pseudomonas moorei]
MDFSVIINSVVQFAVDAYQSLLVIKETLKVAAEAAIAEEKSSIWATLVTDIITVAAALGALALPVSLNVIEAARTRYRSPSLLKLTSSLSGVDAKNLNRQLFLILAASVVAKVYISLQIYRLILLVPYLCALTIWFGCVVIRVYWHLRFTYVFMSNIESVQGRIFKVINKYAGSGFFGGVWWSG